ncbi:MAG: imelysin family protein [Rhodospirillales bacterium]
MRRRGSWWGVFAVASRLPVLAMLLVASAAAGADPPDATALKAIVERTVSGYAVPASAGFALQAKRLAADANAGCRNGTPVPESLRGVFRDAGEAWGRLSAARFGPLTAEARQEKLAFWPDDRGVIRRQTAQLAANLPTDAGEAAEWLAKQSAAVQGLPAFDLLVFAEAAPKSCPMAIAVAANIERLAKEVSAGFADPSRLAILSPGPTNPLYLNELEAVAELFRALTTQADVLRTIMIQPALGISPDEAKPSRLFLRYAPATKSYLTGAVEGLEQMLSSMALESLVLGEGRMGLDAAHRELKTAREMVAALPIDPAAAIADPQFRGKLATAALALEGFNRAVALEISPALGLRMGFNALDGD